MGRNRAADQLLPGDRHDPEGRGARVLHTAVRLRDLVRGRLVREPAPPGPPSYELALLDGARRALSARESRPAVSGPSPPPRRPTPTRPPAAHRPRAARPGRRCRPPARAPAPPRRPGGRW